MTILFAVQLDGVILYVKKSEQNLPLTQYMHTIFALYTPKLSAESSGVWQIIILAARKAFYPMA